MMLLDLKLALLILWTHFVADFIWQSDKMAKNKSKSNYWLSIHIGVYTLPFFVWGWKFALFNGAAHWITDWCTSRVTSKLWAKGDVHNFFVVIGLDQVIHATTLLTSAWYLL